MALADGRDWGDDELDHLEARYLPPSNEHGSPIAFAEKYSRGRWRRAPHLELIETAVLEAIDTAGRLIISVAIRHGKSELISRWLIAWYLGRYPDRRVLLATHSADLATAHGRFARDTLIEHGPNVFGVSVSKRSEAAGRWDLAQPHAGGMLALGVGGSPIGRGGDLVLVDDPYGSYEDAMSATTRKRVIEWWTGTMETRIEPGGAVIVICSRWHEEDLTGFLLDEAGDEWTELRMPAIADDEADPLGREIGEALWPERYPLDELERRHKATSLSLGEAVWTAQFQQTPTTPTGGMFPEDRWGTIEPNSIALLDVDWVRGWDLAATEDAGDWTVGAKVGRLADGRFVVDDVHRGQWAPDEVRAAIRTAANVDGKGVPVELPQDPAQAGKDQAQQMVRMLSGWDAQALPQSGSKVTRATGFSAQQRAGNVLLVKGPWNRAWIVEHKGFPKGKHDDQVDAGATAFNRLVAGEGLGDEEYERERKRGR